MRLEHGSSQLRTAPVGTPGWIAESPALEQLLLDRDCLGVAFTGRVAAAVDDLLGHVLDGLGEQPVAELMLLSKGGVYGLHAAAARAGLSLPVNMMGTSRLVVSGDQATVEVTYVSTDAPADTLLIGDTVASGASIQAALERYSTSFTLRRVIILSLACAGVGARAIGRWCDEHDIDLTIVMGLASFGLADNGFDLSFLDPLTECQEHYREHTRMRFDGRPVSAVGWDFGSQAVAPDKYRALCWVERRYWDLEHTDAFVLARQPTSRRQIEHEHAAFAARLGDIDSLVAR